MKRRTHALLFATVVLMACTNDDSGDGFPATEDGLRKAATAQAQAFIDSPASTYDFLTDDCQAKVTRSDWAAQMLLAMGLLEGFIGTEVGELQVGDVQVRNVADGRGEAAVELLDPNGKPIDSETSFSTFVHEDGTWKSPECDEGFDDSATADTGPTTTFDGELRPSDEVREEQARADALAITLGESFALGDLTVVVTSVELGNPDTAFEGETPIVVELRAENRSGEEQAPPDVDVFCLDGSTATSFGEGTFDQFEQLPNGSFEEGTVQLGVPGECEAPVVRISSFFDEVDADYPLDDLLADA
jgi:hypothetical protein